MLQEFKIIYKAVLNANPDIPMPKEFDIQSQRFITVFHSPIEEVWQFVLESIVLEIIINFEIKILK